VNPLNINGPQVGYTQPGTPVASVVAGWGQVTGYDLGLARIPCPYGDGTLARQIGSTRFSWVCSAGLHQFDIGDDFNFRLGPLGGIAGASIVRVEFPWPIIPSGSAT